MLVARVRLKDSAVFEAMQLSLREGVKHDQDHVRISEMYVRVEEMNCDFIMGTVLTQELEPYTEPDGDGTIECRTVIHRATVAEAIPQDAIIGRRISEDGKLALAFTLVDSSDRLWRGRSIGRDWLS